MHAVSTPGLGPDGSNRWHVAAGGRSRPQLGGSLSDPGAFAAAPAGDDAGVPKGRVSSDPSFDRLSSDFSEPLEEGRYTSLGPAAGR